MTIAEALGRAIAKMAGRQERLASAHIPREADTLAAWIDCADTFRRQLAKGQTVDKTDVRELLGGLDVKAAVQVADSLVLRSSHRPRLDAPPLAGDTIEPGLELSAIARQQLAALKANPAHEARAKAVKNALGHLETNPRHPGLNTHQYHQMSGPNGEKMYEAYAQNHTPGAYRIFFYYGDQGRPTIHAITPHP